MWAFQLQTLYFWTKIFGQEKDRPTSELKGKKGLN